MEDEKKYCIECNKEIKKSLIAKLEFYWWVSDSFKEKFCCIECYNLGLDKEYSRFSESATKLNKDVESIVGKMLIDATIKIT